MPSWTNDQQRAIKTRGGKVIVSAAAGSGKTAVLSERVIDYVLSNGNINDLLIVTFTEAAAGEMKQRIKDKLISKYELTKNEHIKKQISLIDVSDITTMDAFYGKLVKENFNKLGINRNYKILSNEEEKILKNIVAINVIENCLEKQECNKMIDIFADSSSSLIKNTIIKIADFLDTIPSDKEFINMAIDNYDEKNNIYKSMLFNEINEKMNSLKKLYKEIIEELYNESDVFDKLIINVNKELNLINDLSVISSFNSLQTRLRSFEFDRLITPKGHKDDGVMFKYRVIRENLKNEINKNLTALTSVNESIYKEEQLLCKENLKVLFDVTLEYRDRLLENKILNNNFSFSDISRFVIKLLIKDGKKTPLASNISKKYKEILIDEYQDTNSLQNVIFSSISNNDSNLFIVGDVKQSIYKFRSACPMIFTNDKNNAFKDKFPMLITLSKNFRSRDLVLNFCNFIFENTMSNLFGEVDYNEDEKLYLGAGYQDNPSAVAEVDIIDGKEKNSEVEDELKSSEKEAVLVADKINSLIESKYQVYDNKDECFRDIKASDIVILLRSLSNSNFYLEALNKRKIGVFCEKSPVYFDNYEIKLIINLLKILDNPYDDVAITSCITSSLFNINFDDISLLRASNKYVSIYENLKTSLNNDIINFINDIEYLRNYSLVNSVSDLLIEVYNKFDVINILCALKDGDKREKNINEMINHAINFESGNNRSLHEFIDYIESIILNSGSLEGINPLSEGVNVLITTIHKSKGLEYPVVFLCETGKKFNFKDLQNDLMINSSLGVSFTIKNSDNFTKYESIPLKVFKEEEKLSMLSEELRILYVALTRAKEKLIITGYTSNLESKVTKAASKMGDEKNISLLYLKGATNYLDIILPCLLRHPSGKDLRSLSNICVKTFSDESNINLNIVNSININESEFNDKKESIKKDFDYNFENMVLHFKYNYEESLIPTRLSVSDIKLVDHKNYVKSPDFMKDGISHTKLGTLYHKIFELLEVKKYSVKSLECELNKLVIKRKITKEELEMVDIIKVLSYLTSDLYDMILSSSNVYKEKKVTFKVPANYYDDESNGSILIDGVIDLLFINDGCYYILDYKTDNVSDMKELISLYKKQLDLYEIAVKNLYGKVNVKKYIYSIKLNKYIEV